MKIAPHLKKPFRLDGIYRIDDTPVHVAVREALVNCLSNADYFLSVPVKIELFPDRLVFSNPGTIRLGKKQMLHGGITSPRNKATSDPLIAVPNFCAIVPEEKIKPVEEVPFFCVA